MWVDGKQQWEVEKILGKREEEVMMEVKESGEDEMKEESKRWCSGRGEEGGGRATIQPESEREGAPPEAASEEKKTEDGEADSSEVLGEVDGYPESEAEWRPADELMECQKLVDEYEWRQQEERGEDSVALQYSVVVRNRAEGRGVQCQLISVQ